MEKQELKETINAFCTENGLSKAAFGKKCGVSSATLSFTLQTTLVQVNCSLVRDDTDHTCFPETRKLVCST